MLVMSDKTNKRRGSRHKDRHTVSLPQSAYDLLKAIAEKNKRPASWQLRIIIEAAARDANLPPATDED